MRRFGMLRDGLRARRRVHLAGFATAVLVVAAAVVGAVFSAAAQESILRDTVAAASGTASLHLVASLSPDSATYPPDLFDDALKGLPPDGRYAAFPHRIGELSFPTDVRVSAAAGKQPTRLVWRQGFCAHVRVVAGRCPTATGEGMVSKGTLASGPGWRLGATVDAGDAGALRVVGVYQPVSVDDPFWSDGGYFDGGLQTAAGSDPSADDQVVAADAILTPESELVDRVHEEVHAQVDYPIAPDATVIGDGSALRADVAAIRRSLVTSPFALTTNLAYVLRSADVQRAYVQQGAQLVAVQLGLLGSVVLFFLTLDLTEGRRREIALAKLRGQSWPAIVRFALAEPLLVIVAALPVGLLVGWGAGAVLGALLLRPGTPVALPPAAVGAAAVALVGAAVAAALSTQRVVARPVLDQWRETGGVVHPRRTALLLVAVAVVAWGGAVALVLTAEQGSATIVSVPLLLLAGVALLGVPVLVVLAARVAPRTRATDRIARFLAVRQLARGTAVRRTAVLLVATLGLATFAVGGQSVLVGNRAARADAELGAPRVVSVTFDPGVDPVLAARRADPGGTWATAVGTWLPDDGISVVGTVLAVDPKPFAAIALPVRGGIDDRALASLVDAEALPPIAVRGTRVTARLTGADPRGGVGPDVIVVLRTALGAEVRVGAGSLRAGTHDYSAAVACGSGCTLTGLVWSYPVTATRAIGGTVTVRSVDVQQDGTSSAAAARLTRAGAWRAAVPVSEATDAVTIGADGVTDRFRIASGEGGVEYASARRPLPAVVSPGGLASERPDGGWSLDDAYGNAVAFTPVRRVAMLPAVLDAGVVVDASALERALPEVASTARWQVWLSASAPADALHRLHVAGLATGAVSTIDEREAELAREGPALAFSLLLALAVVAAVLAMLATAVAAGAAARGRAREAAALRLIGVPVRAVVRAAVLEQVLLLAASAVLAVPAGVAGVLLVLPRLRESSSTSPVALEFLPPVLPIVVLVAAYAVAVGAMATSTAATVVRSARPSRLREVDS